jgi:hypothetical protein
MENKSRRVHTMGELSMKVKAQVPIKVICERLHEHVCVCTFHIVMGSGKSSLFQQVLIS